MNIEEESPLIEPIERYYEYEDINFLGITLKYKVINLGAEKPVLNVILMISDGFGPASQTFARNFNQVANKLDYGAQLPLDTILVGSSRTRSSSSLVTDSAAGATAFACVLKTFNAAIGVDKNKNPCGTVLEAAKEKGMMTGLVATSRITHATPASFASHVVFRDMEDEIAIQEVGNYTLGRNVDLMFGGGKCFFLPNSDQNSCRQDNIDVLKLAETYGWSIGFGRDDFDRLTHKSKLPTMNLFSYDHMSYEIDRIPTEQPSLKEMAAKALEILTTSSKRHNTGFFLMIEGSRIDMAAHSNDPAAHVHDILAYNDAIDVVKQYVDRNPGTVMISVSDHETGGFSLGHQHGDAYPIYDWYPQYLLNVRHSGEYIAQKILEVPLLMRASFVRDTVLNNWLDIKEPDQENIDYLSSPLRKKTELEYYCGKIISELAGLGWSTHGHSAVDVNLYAYGSHSSELVGNHENTDIGDFIRRNLNLKRRMDDITERLNK